MSSPPKPPYGELIEQARLEAGISKREAARRAGISDAWWRYVTEGRQGETPVPGTAETVAAMARAVGLSPERLEGEGSRPDAAALLREPPRIPRTETEPAEPEPARNPFAHLAPDEPEDDAAWVMFPGPGDKLLRWIWRLPVPVSEREQLVRDVRARRRAAQDPPGRESAGLADDNIRVTVLNFP